MLAPKPLWSFGSIAGLFAFELVTFIDFIRWMFFHNTAHYRSLWLEWGGGEWCCDRIIVQTYGNVSCGNICVYTVVFSKFVLLIMYGNWFAESFPHMIIYFAMHWLFGWNGIHVCMLLYKILMQGWPFSHKYFSGLQWKSDLKYYILYLYMYNYI